VLQKLVRSGRVARGSRVVVVSTAHGLKFPDFKVGYHRGGLAGVEGRHANPPVEVEAEPAAAAAVIARWLDSGAVT
jgi:threonine synthase